MKIKITLLLLTVSLSAFCKVWTVVNSGLTFSPNTLTIAEGDSVNFVLANSHTALEVSQATWNNNNNTALLNGFGTNFGGGMILPAKLTIGTHYYVCEPHAGSVMKGQIIVQSAVGVLENAVSNVSIYPNPAGDFISVRVGKGLLGSSYTMFDLTGRQVLSSKLVNETTGVDLSQLKDGVYFLQIGTEGKQTFKVIKN
ncbi:MAG: T9SS type A sorting domain-containing protein [Bacteroidetes bacterium]|nr:T9SS type A sorting domain-containing protein [Bacteroidota bacterium]